MKEVDGLINAKRPKPAEPKPSPKDFVWPKQSDHDDVVAKKIAASLQELLPAREWTHSQLARELWGTDHEGKVRNIAKARGWLVADHPIPNEEHAAYLAQVLDVSMARLLEPEGKFSPHPPLIRKRSPNGVNLSKMGKKKKKGTVKADRTPSGKDREKQREYNAAYRARLKKAKAKTKRPYVKRVHTNGSGAPVEHDPSAWILEEGVPVPTYEMSSHEEIPNHVKLTIDAVVPQPRAMAILHMLEHFAPAEEED